MRTHLPALAGAACLAVVLAGCPETKTTPTDSSTSSGSVSVQIVQDSVVANGTNTVTVNVTNTTGQTVSLQTDKGTFQVTGTINATVAGASGTLTLVTCNATTAGCVGTAHVSALAGASVSTDTVTFVSLASACSADCTADAGCPTLACVGTTGAGTCSSTTPSSCVVPSGGGGGGGDTTTPGTVIRVTPSRLRVPPDGTTVVDVVVEVLSDGVGTSGVAVSLTKTGPGTLSSGTGTTGADGSITFTLTAPTTAGVANLTAATTVAPIYTATATVTFPRLGAILLADPAVDPAVLGVKGSGWQESGFFHVRVVDDAGEPYPDGVAVRFEHQQLGGSTFATPLTADTTSCLASGRCIGYQALTTSGGDAPDSDGLAAARIYSGTVAGTLAVTASANVGGVTRSVALPTMAVVGAKANGANFSIVCGPRNVPALAETDCAVSLVDAPFTCMAIAKDRYGNMLGRSTQVVFASEASAVGQIATTPPYDPASDPVSQTELGTAVQIFSTLGAGLPFDVAPQPGEPSNSHAQDGCGTRTHNPRDGVVTVYAAVDGEEAFFDENGNGVYDSGEPFVDQGEPFVDADDDGVYDVATTTLSGEAFLDVSGNGAYNGPNGTWDGSTKIWTQTVVVYTGSAAQLDVPPVAPATEWRVLGTRWSDSAVQACTATLPDPGFSVAGSNPGPATSVSRYVYASDMNLNRLSEDAGYSTSVAYGTLDVTYGGLAAYADDLGIFYRYWPCDKNGANCASQCRVTDPLLQPCLMKPSLASYSCGIGAWVNIEGGATAGAAGAGWHVDTTYSLYERTKTQLTVETLGGTVF